MSSVQRYALLSIVHHFVKVGTNGLPLKDDARPSFVLGGPSVTLHCDAVSNTIQPASEVTVSVSFSLTIFQSLC